MKITKSRIIFFAIALTYNLLLGLYLKDFLVLSQTLTVFYLFGLPTLFLLTEVRSKAMRAIVYIVLVLDILVNFIYFVCCRRLLPVMTMLLLVIEQDIGYVARTTTHDAYEFMLNTAENQMRDFKRRGMSGQNRDFAPAVEANRVAMCANNEDYGLRLQLDWQQLK